MQGECDQVPLPCRQSRLVGGQAQVAVILLQSILTLRLQLLQLLCPMLQETQGWANVKSLSFMLFVLIWKICYQPNLALPLQAMLPNLYLLNVKLNL